LRYVVEQTLAGRAEDITEYGGLDVFQKPASFDPRMQVAVRVEMSRLRRALADYYEKAGSADPWRIEFPKRGYMPAIVGHPALQAGRLAAHLPLLMRTPAHSLNRTPGDAGGRSGLPRYSP
jgi:adenylate cyclase